MSIIVAPTPLFCLNADCDRELSEWELKRKHPTRLSKWWFCSKCRTIHHRTTMYVICDKCDNRFIQNNNQKYCDDCVHRSRGRDTS